MVGLSNKKLRTSIPSCGYIIGHFSKILGNESGEPKITQFKDIFVLTDQNILGFNVSMNDIFVVEKLETLDYLVDDLLDEFGLL